MISRAARLRELMQRDDPVVGPLVLDPISARMAEATGFEYGYLGGGAMGYVKTATEANLSLIELVHAGLEIHAATTLPLIMDGTCGWGDPMHVHHTIAMTETAGFAAIEIEDQLLPKRAHHHVDREHLIPSELMVDKIKEAVAARRDPDFVIIGRTNACRTDGVDEGLRRAEAYKRAGADMLLILPRDPEQARIIGERIEGPLFYMMLAGPASIGMSLQELGALGYKVVVDAMTPFFARQKALRLCYEALAAGLPDPTVGAEYREEVRRVHEVIDLEKLLDIERRTVER
jgi:2-methylisocitrate lyase-like PEP mutase family enzyme